MGYTATRYHCSLLDSWDYMFLGKNNRLKAWLLIGKELQFITLHKTMKYIECL